MVRGDSWGWILDDLEFSQWLNDMHGVWKTRVVLTPGDPYMRLSNEKIIAKVLDQVRVLTFY